MGMDLGQAMSKAWEESWRQFNEGPGQVIFGRKAEAPKVAQTSFAQPDESRALMMPILADLQRQYAAMASGNGPSLAQGQLQQATDSNIRNAMALGAAQQGQGLGYASALRNIADQSAAARQQAAAQSALIRNAEQMQALQGLGGVAGAYGGVRGQDLSQTGMIQQGNQFQAGLDMQANIANAGGGILPGLLQAGGAILGGALGGPAGAAAGGKAGGAVGGGLSNGSGPVLDGGFRTYSPPMGDYRTPMPGGPLYGSTGGQVPGYARGGALNSTSNDTVPAMLSPGEIVIPRSITMAPDAPERARLFVQAVMQRQKNGPQSDRHHLRRKAA